MINIPLADGRAVIVEKGNLFSTANANAGYTIGIRFEDGGVTGTWTASRSTAIRRAKALCQEHGVKYEGPNR